MFKKIIFFTLIIILIPLLIVGINDKEKIIYKIKYGSISNKKVRVKRTKTKSSDCTDGLSHNIAMLS